MDTPRSLKTGAGRQYWDEVVRLLVKIRTDCDAAAERLGYASNEENGLAAVEYIARKTLEAVQGERQRQIASAEKGSPAPVRPPHLPRQSSTEPGNNSKKRAQQTDHSERSKLIDELKQMLRDGKTKSGAVIDPQLAHVIAKQITTLNEEIAQPETTESIKRMRESIAGFYGKAYGNRKKAFKAPAVAVAKNEIGQKEPARTQRRIPRPEKREVDHARPRGAIAIGCARKRLTEVWLCQPKDLQFHDCPEIAKRSCRRDQLIMPATRDG
jgi:hypothetical protein